MDVPEEAAELYGLPLDEFTRSRDVLAKELREKGNRDEASAVRKLRKPNLAAWALNQLARQRPDEVRSLLYVGDRLRRAQRKVMSGGSPEDMRTVAAERKKIVASLVKAAEAILTDAGHAAARATMAAVEDALVATATNERGAEQLRSGTLERPLEAGSVPDIGGFTVLDGGSAQVPAGTAEPAASGAQPDPEAQRRLEEARSRLADAEARLETAEREAARLQGQAGTSERVAADAAQDAQRAERRAEDLRREAEEAERVAERLRQRATEALEARTSARQAAEAAKQEAERRRAELAEAERVLRKADRED